MVSGPVTPNTLASNTAITEAGLRDCYLRPSVVGRVCL
ncbi:hypothetical protein ANO14919_006640 [Xylariales sp. No.14919]|nr:hypothetical protein ANO14919_006640 [Xylariales sp. No.14919]